MTPLNGTPLRKKLQYCIFWSLYGWFFLHELCSKKKNYLKEIVWRGKCSIEGSRTFFYNFWNKFPENVFFIYIHVNRPTFHFVPETHFEITSDIQIFPEFWTPPEEPSRIPSGILSGISSKISLKNSQEILLWWNSSRYCFTGWLINSFKDFFPDLSLGTQVFCEFF